MLHLGPYQVVASLARGGMSEVFTGVHSATGASVAIKCLRRASDGRDVLQAEVEAIARLDHPHIVRVYDYGRLPSSLDGVDGELAEQQQQ